MKKIMILADSCGFPRSFPEDGKVSYEETFPCLLRQHFADASIAQVGMGGITTSDLLGQAIAYFNHWEPDLIVVLVGGDDCRPEPLPNLLWIMIGHIKALARLKSFILKPRVMSKMIRIKAWERMSAKEFKRNIKKFRAVFPGAQILWLEIFTSGSGKYEEHRPGILGRIAEFNAIIKSVLKSGFVPLQDELTRIDGVNSDHIHMNRRGHFKTFEILRDRIEAFYSNSSASKPV